MEFAIVNNYMGPVATKVMKGYSDEDMRIEDDIKVQAIFSRDFDRIVRIWMFIPTIHSLNRFTLP